MAVATERDIGIDTLCREMSDVLVRAIAGVGEDSLGPAAGIGLDRIDQGGQGASVGWIGGDACGHDDLRGLVHDGPGVVCLDPAVGSRLHDARLRIVLVALGLSLVPGLVISPTFSGLPPQFPLRLAALAHATLSCLHLLPQLLPPFVSF